MQIFTNLITQPIISRLLFSGIIVIVTFLIQHILSKLILNIFSKISVSKIPLNLTDLEALRRPIRLFLLSSGFFIAILVSPFVRGSVFSKPIIIDFNSFSFCTNFISSKFIFQIYFSLLALLVTSVIYHFEEIYERIFTEINAKHSLIDNALFIRYVFKIIRFITLIIGISAALSTLFPGLSKVLTSLGIGGVAVAFISKDTLSSLFSGMILLLDKPFTTGDWITLNDVDGIVEDISFRSTSIRTFSQSLVDIPNNVVANSNITNWSKMTKRRVAFDLGLSYHTSAEQITHIVSYFEKMIAQDTDIEKETISVKFTEFGDYSLNLKIVFFTLKTDLASYLAIQERINLSILDYCNKNNIDIAFPTQTILMNHE